MSYSPDFERAFDLIIGHEGGYVNDPRDPGGETKYGIAKRFHPEVDIAMLTPDQAKRIYWNDYWLPSGAGHLPWASAYVLFDAVVNMGLPNAVRLMQMALGEVADGVIGPRTRAAMKRRGADPELIVNFQAERGLYYASRAHFDTYGRGWLRRVIRGAMQAVTGEAQP